MATIEKSLIEIEIVQLLSNQDSSCLSLVYQHYSAALYGVIFKIVKTDVEAEEVLQDVFLKFWQNAKSYDPQKSRLFTWLLNIARNSAIDRIRSKGFKNSRKTDHIDNYVDFDVNLQIEATSEDSGLLTVINGLDEKYKELIYLVYYEGYSQREITKEFDIPLGTVKTRLNTAIKKLRAELNDEMIKKLLFIFPFGHLLVEVIKNGY